LREEARVTTLADRVANGSGAMPAFAFCLSKQEVDDVATYDVARAP
jgi:mono/diheme cytochrome c family protein